MRALSLISYLLVIVGAINWGMIGLLNFDLVAFLFGSMTFASKIVYSLVGIAALTSLILNIQDDEESPSSCFCS